MAVISFKIEDHTAQGLDPNIGHVVFTPTRIHTNSGGGIGTMKPFTVKYDKSFDVELANTSAEWLWKISVNSPTPIVVGYYAITNNTSFAELIAVEPDSSWWVKLNQLINMGGGPAGKDGKDGKDGVNGKLTTLVGGTVTKLPPGSQPTAEVTGTLTQKQLNLGLVTGDPGKDGSNVLPTNTAIAQAIRENGETKNELSAAFVQKSKVKADGTDQTATVLSEWASVQSTGGGAIIYPSGVIRIDGRLTPNYTLDGSGAPVQPTLLLVGGGKQATGRGSGVNLIPEGGTVFDMRWSDPDLKKAKFHSRGFGYLEISGITFADQGATPTLNPFFKHTNTTVNIHDVGGIGHTSLKGVTCAQDLIVAGGQTTPVSGDFSLDDDAPFQGYGSVYKNIWHNNIRRAIVGGAYFNQVTIQDVAGWQNSGNATGGMIEIDPGTSTAQGCYGVSISNVLGESGAYKQVVNLRKVARSEIRNVGSFDYASSTTYVSAINLVECSALTIIRGYDDIDGVHPYITSPGNWREMATLIHGSQTPNAEEANIAARVQLYNGATVRAHLGGGGAALKFARPADATTGNQVTFSLYGRTWGFSDGLGADLTIDSGTGGSYINHKGFGHRFHSHNGPLRCAIGEGIDGFKLGAAGAETIQRHATGVVKTNARMRGDKGLSTMLSVEPAVGTIDIAEGVWMFDPTPGAAKAKFVGRDLNGTVVRAELPMG